MSFAIVANPASGMGRGRRYLPRVQRRLEDLAIPYVTFVTAKRGDAREFARLAAAAGHDTIVAVGGDGTLFEVLNGVMDGPHRPRLAQIPVGTGNSFIMDLEIRDAAAGLLALGSPRTRRVDIARASSSAGSFHFINLAGSGFVARVARRAERLKFLGALAYVIAVFAELPGLRPRRLEIVADGRRSVREALFIEVCNSTKTGGRMIMAPSARIDDGLLDVVIARSMGRLRLLSLFPSIFAGTHVRSPFVETFTCGSIEACFSEPEPVTPDGEISGDSPLQAEVLPLAVEILVP